LGISDRPDGLDGEIDQALPVQRTVAMKPVELFPDRVEYPGDGSFPGSQQNALGLYVRTGGFLASPDP
jgi:hypothetical protein